MFSDPQFWVAVAFFAFILAIFNPVRKILVSNLDNQIKQITGNINEAENLKNEANFNLRTRHPDFEDYFTKWRKLSKIARKTLSCELDIAYGSGPNMTLDLFPAEGSNNPLLIFVHGGYWRSLDKSDH